jgi:predicted DNA-binding protein (UPF0251 family)
MAPPRIALTARDLRAIERMAGCGLTQQEIAATLGISGDTLTRRKLEANETAVAEALERGRAKAAAAVGNALYRKALKGDVPAIRWFEATRFGRSEKQVLEHHAFTIEDLIRDAEHGDDDRDCGAASDCA